MTQPPVSNEVLFEKTQGFFDRILQEIGFLRKDLNSYEERLHKLEDHEALSVEWHHQHEQGPSHPDLQRKHVDFEMAIAEVRREGVAHIADVRKDYTAQFLLSRQDITMLQVKLQTRETDDAYKKGVKDGMAKSLSMVDKIWVIFMAALPTTILIYTQLVR